MICPGSHSESLAEEGGENCSCLTCKSGFSGPAQPLPRASAPLPSPPLPNPRILSYLEADFAGAALALGQVRAALATPGPGKEAQGRE